MHRLLCLKASRISLTAVLAAAIIAGCTTRHPAPVVERTAKPKPPIPAPAVGGTQAAPRPGDTRPEFHTVRRGDTLYSIALDHRHDYRELALWNGRDNPAALQVGQQLRLSPAPGMVVTAPLKAAPGVEARPLATAPPPPPPGSGRVKPQPKGVRLPYSEQAYAQLANVKPEAGLAPSPAKTDSTAPPAAPEGDELQSSWPASGKIVSGFNDGANLKGIAIAGKAGQPIFAS